MVRRTERVQQNEALWEIIQDPQKEQVLLNILQQEYESGARESVYNIVLAGIVRRQSPTVDLCEQALLEIGPTIATRLQQLLDRCQLPPLVRKRIRRIIAAIREDSQSQPIIPSQLVPIILSAVKHNEAEILSRLSCLARFLPRHQVCDWLVLEALDHVADKKYFRKCLQAAELTEDSPSRSLSSRVLTLRVTEKGVIRSSCRHFLDTCSMDAQRYQSEPEIPPISPHVDPLCPHVLAERMALFCPGLFDPMWMAGYHLCPSAMMGAAMQKCHRTVRSRSRRTRTQAAPQRQPS